MAQAGKPTKKTRHIDIKHFSIQQWTELDLILLKHIKTSINSSDSMTKAVARTLFYWHMDYIMGRVPPQYSSVFKRVHDLLRRPKIKLGTNGLPIAAAAACLKASWDTVTEYYRARLL